MTGPCFVDADVFLYARDPRDARKQERAAQWIDLLWRERLGVRSPFTLQVSEAGAMYAVERRAANVHRPRGRPRRAAAPA